MKTNAAFLGSMILMLSLGATAAHASTAFDGTRLVQHTDASHTKSTKGTLTLDASTQQLSFTDKGQQQLAITYSGINSMRLENTISRLHRPFTHRVGRDEFLTIEYHAGNDSQYAVFKLDGKSYRELLAALETQTGKQVEYKTN